MNDFGEESLKALNRKLSIREAAIRHRAHLPEFPSSRLPSYHTDPAPPSSITVRNPAYKVVSLDKRSRGREDLREYALTLLSGISRRTLRIFVERIKSQNFPVDDLIDVVRKGRPESAAESASQFLLPPCAITPRTGEVEAPTGNRCCYA